MPRLRAARAASSGSRQAAALRAGPFPHDSLAPAFFELNIALRPASIRHVDCSSYRSPPGRYHGLADHILADPQFPDDGKYVRAPPSQQSPVWSMLLAYAVQLAR